MLLVLAVAVTGCSSQGSTTSTKELTATIGEETEATLTVPEKWTYESGEESYAVITPTDFDGFIWYGINFYQMSLYTKDIEVLDYIDENFLFGEGNWKKDGETNDSPVYIREITLDNYKGYFKTAISGNDCVSTLAVANEDEWSKAENEIQSVIDSFAITNPRAPEYSSESSVQGSKGSADNQSTSSDDDATTTQKETSKTTAYKAGSYRVGTDIPAGEYKITCSGSHGYYCVYPDTTKSDILSNGNFTTCTYVTVSDGQLLEVTGSTFAAIADAQATTTLRGEGIYKVGLDIAAGEYNITAIDDSGYYAVLSTVDANVSSNIVNNDNFEGNSFISVTDGQYLEISRASIGS